MSRRISAPLKTGQLLSLRRGDVVQNSLLGVEVLKTASSAIVLAEEQTGHDGWSWALCLTGRGVKRVLWCVSADAVGVWFAPGLVIDQTYGYINKDRKSEWTTNHKAALLFKHAVNCLGHHYDFVEVVWDVEEFRGREDTW